MLQIKRQKIHDRLNNILETIQLFTLHIEEKRQIIKISNLLNIDGFIPFFKALCFNNRKSQISKSSQCNNKFCISFYYYYYK